MAPPVRLGERIFAALVSAACLGVLALAAWITPSPEGHGTHTQLGLSDCQWAVMIGRPCPTCGMTTSFAHATDGSLAQAARVQPFGALLSLGVAAAFWVSLHVAVTGSRAGRIFVPLARPKWVISLVGLLLAAWVYKMAVW